MLVVLVVGSIGPSLGVHAVAALASNASTAVATKPARFGVEAPLKKISGCWPVALNANGVCCLSVKAFCCSKDEEEIEGTDTVASFITLRCKKTGQANKLLPAFA